jgi:3-dehydroquinate synthetase
MATPETSAAALAERIVHVDLGARSYDVLVGADLVGRAGDMIVSRFGKARAAIVTDENVARHHLATLESSLRTFDRHLGTHRHAPGRGDEVFCRTRPPERGPAGTEARAW